MSTRRRTPAEISKIVTQYHDSSQSRHNFARRHGIAPATLARWLQRRPADSAGANFVRVITPPPASTWFVLALPDGRRLRIPAGCDPAALRGVLEVLSAC